MKNAILKLLKGNSEYLSGEEISNILGVSRTAIWKHIRTLKSEGYVIESQTKLGYLLLKVPDRMYPEEIKGYLKTAQIGGTILYEDTVDSTNITAKDIADQGFEEGTVVVAEMQTAGKGRLGRGWHSSYGTGIWMSVMVRPTIMPVDAPKITLLTAISVAQAIRQETGVSPGIKWPNDILIKGKKVCGILTEIKADMDLIHYIIVGIGINVNESEFSSDISNIATSLKMETGRDINRVKMAAAVLNNWEENYFEFLQRGFSRIKSAWREFSINLGQEVTVTTLKDTIQGRAIDIDDDGLLLVEDNRGTLHKIVAGDVSLRKGELNHEN
ncbi:MAG: biotin--[acetyl-CoA-carboxylase] ligase [Dehalobacterium sp.]